MRFLGAISANSTKRSLVQRPLVFISGAVCSALMQVFIFGQSLLFFLTLAKYSGFFERLDKWLLITIGKVFRKANN